jgi:hypothetical protein
MLPQDGQKRAAPEISLPQAGQFIIGAEYITACLDTQTQPTDQFDFDFLI